MAGAGIEPPTNKDIVAESENEGNGGSISESAECANQQWAEYFDTMHKFEEEEAKKTEELRRAIAEATAEEKRLRQHIDRYKEHIARFMASFSSKVLKDE